MNQDSASGVLSFTPAEFVVADHPILKNVTEFQGEGTSFVTVLPGANVTIIVKVLSFSLTKIGYWSCQRKPWSWTRPNTSCFQQ
jgi:hypothetical protein